MRFVHIPSPPSLPRRWPKVYAARTSGLALQTTHVLRAAYFRRYGSWGILKKWLAKASADKCWYCEAKGTRAPLDVDHFRPKLAVTVDGAELAGHDGYYWLAYEWWNFRLSCQRCNRPEKDEVDILRGKANEFPVRDEQGRSGLPAAQLANEVPRLLDPCVEEDCELLAHGVDGEVKPAAPRGSWEHLRAAYTIKLLGLNAWHTPEVRKGQWQTLATLLAVVGNNANQDVIDELKKYLSCDHEYSSFFRAAIGTHRDKIWIEALL